MLRNLRIEYLVIYGVVTDQCVESAIRDAADRGFMVTQIEECCAADTPDNHSTSIESMRGHYCRTRSTDEMLLEFALMPDAGLEAASSNPLTLSQPHSG